MSWHGKMVIICEFQGQLFAIPRIRVRPGEMPPLVSPHQMCLETVDGFSWNLVGHYGGGGALPGHWKHWTGILKICLFILGGQTVLSKESAFFCLYNVWMRGQAAVKSFQPWSRRQHIFLKLYFSFLRYRSVTSLEITFWTLPAMETRKLTSLNYIIINLYFLSNFLHGSECMREFSHHEF